MLIHPDAPLHHHAACAQLKLEEIAARAYAKRCYDDANLIFNIIMEMTQHLGECDPVEYPILLDFYNELTLHAKVAYSRARTLADADLVCRRHPAATSRHFDFAEIRSDACEMFPVCGNHTWSITI